MEKVTKESAEQDAGLSSVPVLVDESARKSFTAPPDGKTLPQGKAIFSNIIQPITANDENDLGRSRTARIGYYEGLRGILMLLSLLYIFLRIFVPAVVADRDLDETYPAKFIQDAPNWQNIVRKVVSAVLLDATFLSSAFVFLSGRVVMQTFLERRSTVAVALAGALFRRPIQLALPVCIAFAFTSVLVVCGAMPFVDQMGATLMNQSAAKPEIWDSVITYVNACVGMFMDTSTSKIARGPAFLPPSNVGWVVPAIFQLSYLAGVLAYLFPYLVLRWKLLGTAIFVLAAWWSGRWAWYTSTAILFAELHNIYSGLIPKAFHVPIIGTQRRLKLPLKVFPLALMLLGSTSKYLLTIYPEYLNRELIAHVDPTNARLNKDYDVTLAYPRLDDYCIIVGIFFLIDTTPRLQRLLDNAALRFLGSLAWSSMLTSGTIMLCVGSALWHHLTFTARWQSESLTMFVVFLVCIPASVLFSTFWRYTVDDGSRFLSRKLFVFMIT